MSDDPEVLTTTAAGLRIVRVSGEFDFDSAENLARALAPAPGDAPAGTVLDLSQVTFADSSFLHVLLRAAGEHRAAGTPLLLVRPSPPVARLLEVTDTTGSFTFVDSVTAAASAARAAPGGEHGEVRPVSGPPRRADGAGRREDDESEGGEHGGPRHRDEPCAPPHHRGGGA
ncbi:MULTISPECIES: STAS domain-containing protein [Streptomyces]|uniref:STAS domain-containing protein n=1 Tax=Streptomyces sudanensis TaxID=436397 RepID=A0ABY4THU4_9ACTN|nr:MULTISPECIES: STAS domain-containing protein [Streptomyces]MCP9999481.1 STAS domain-containing protein [Streptomyces sudanensis]URN18468.1 STAS domain-containing protein [Streptomyces sudanensis]